MRLTQDTHETICGCGVPIRLLRRGPVVLIPAGHKCPAREIQDGVLRTARAEVACGMNITSGQMAERLRQWGVGNNIG